MIFDKLKIVDILNPFYKVYDYFTMIDSMFSY